MELHEIIKILERIAPPELAEPWDNNGLQIDVGFNHYSPSVDFCETGVYTNG